MWFTVVILSLGVVLCHGASVSRGKYVSGVTREQALQTAHRVLTQYPLVDGHNDLPHQFRMRVQNRVDAVDLTKNVNDQWGNSHTDIPRMRTGQMGGVFWANFVACAKQYKDAVRAGLEQMDTILQFINMYPEHFQLVTTADGIEEAFAAGKIGSLIGLEGGHILDSSVAALRMYYDLGVRYMTLTHSCTTPWADNSYEDDKGEANPLMGLSEWGEKLVVEMNRLGMIVDLSHVAKQTMLDALGVSRAPVIFSHSSVWALCNHNRNVQDDVLQLLATNEGLIQITFVRGFVSCPPAQLSPDITAIADHIEYVRNLVGVDYVGIGADFDGFSSVLTGLEDVSTYPNLFAELVMRGWSDEDLEKLAGRNLVRVFRAVEKVRDEMAAEGSSPMYDWVPPADISDPACRTDN